MKISIFGMGYVGCVTAAALSQRGHEVIGVDVNPVKVRAISEATSPVLESGVEEIIQSAMNSGNLKATTDGRSAVCDTQLSLVCVGTPAKKNGSFEYSHLLHAVREIGEGIGSKTDHHVVAIRSTVTPGTIETLLAPELEKASGKKAWRDFSICANPEFMREGSSLSDFNHPPFVIIGTREGESGKELAEIYRGIEPVLHCTIKTAEMLKYVCNAFHALKITFANEIGNLCRSLGVDSREVMDLFCRDTKLNISPAYLKPGFAFGGPCLPKDLQAMLYQSRNLDLYLPLLSAVMESNRLQLQRGIDLVLEAQARKIGVIGLTFKAGTDDLRDSPMVSLCEALIGKGLELRIYDENLVLEKLIGANKIYIEEQLPHIGRLLCRTLDELLSTCEVIVIGNRYQGLQDRLLKLNGDVRVVDLVGVFEKNSTPRSYGGICW